MRHLTGELQLASDPPTNVYLINGEVYFAERTTDGAISVRLLVEGVITRKQKSKGSVMVSGAEHLGRIFERDDSIDRHAVELCVELMTDDVLTSVSKEMVDRYTMTLYKRHPSGIDRWLPNQSTADAPAVSEDQRVAALSEFQPVLPVPAATNGTVVTQPAVQQPVVQQPVLPPAIQQPTFAELVREPMAPPVEDASAAVAVARAAQPVTRTPERLKLDEWPTESPTQAPAPLAAPAAAVHADEAPGSIADEVADAVRRALAAIDSVLVPDDENAKAPPRPL